MSHRRVGENTGQNKRGSVFEDVGFSAEEARMLEAKTLVWSAIDAHIKKARLRGRQIEKILDVSQPMVSDLTRGDIDKMTLDKLVRYAQRMGLRVELKVIVPSRRRHAAAA